MIEDYDVQLLSRSSGDIRVAVAGLGKMGRIHLACLQQLAAGGEETYYKASAGQQLAKLTPVAVLDVDMSALNDFADIAGFTDLDVLLADVQPHIIVVATPSETHFDYARRCLDAGVHTLVEKPIVGTRAQLDCLIRTARSTRSRLTSGHVERYNPVAIKIVDLVHSGQVQPQRYQFMRTQRHDPRIPDDIITDKIIHDIDLALYFFGPIEHVRVEHVRRHHGQVYEADIAVIHTSGLAGRVFVSWLVDDDSRCRQVSIDHTEGRLTGDFADKQLYLDTEPVICEVPGMIEAANNQIKDELVDFVLYCSEPDDQGRTCVPLLSLTEIHQATVVIDSIRAALSDSADDVATM